MAMSKERKKYWNMTSDELAKATQEFDQEGVAETFGAMTPKAEAAWRMARRKQPRGRSRASRAVKVVSVGIEANLLERADRLARKRHISRAKLVEEGLKSILAENGA
jgi:hypothetical protein